MLVFNTTYTVQNEDARNFVIWIHQCYLPQVEQSGQLSKPRLLRILSHKDEQTECFSLQFDVESTAILHAWYTQQGKALTDEMTKLFGDRFAGFSTIMEVIEG